MSNEKNAITTRQVTKQAASRKVFFVKGEKESLARNAEGQAIVKRALESAGVSMGEVTAQLSIATVKGFNDFACQYNTALLWFTLQESINSKYGVDLFTKLEKVFHIICGAGLSAKDDKGRNIYDKSKSLVTISKKETEYKDDKGNAVKGYAVNMALKKGYTRSDIGKAWAKAKKEIAGKENIVDYFLETYTGKPQAQAKPKKETSLTDIITALELYHDTCSDKKEQEKALAMLEVYYKN